jgi:hypothetical protein
MSQPPPNWPPQQPGNPFSDQPPYGPGGQYPGGQYPGPYGPPQRIEDDPAMRWVLPVGQSVWSIVAGYLGLFSLLCFILGPFAVLCGIVAIFDLKKNPRLSGWGRAIVGIVLGLIASAIMILVLIALAADAR